MTERQRVFVSALRAARSRARQSGICSAMLNCASHAARKNGAQVLPQLAARRAATDLLLGEVDSQTLYLPLIRR